MEKNHLKILSSLIVKFTADVQAENFYFQVKFINCYIREIISFTNKIDIRDLGQSSFKSEFGIAHYLTGHGKKNGSSHFHQYI